MPLPLFLAQRLYARSDRRRRVSRPAIRIATAGVAIGVAVMLLAVSIVIGFKSTIQEKAVGCGGGVIVSALAYDGRETPPLVASDSLCAALQQMPGVRGAARYCFAQGILKTDADFLGIALKGVDAAWDTTFLSRNMVAGQLPAFSGDSASNTIVLSQTIATKLQLSCGDRVYAYFFDGEGVRTRRFTIGGIYQTNLAQYDDVLCYTDLYTTVRLNGRRGNSVDGIEVSTAYDDIVPVACALREQLQDVCDDDGNALAVATIQDNNPHIFAWLDLLDMNVWVILVLMVLVASVAIISGLLIIILERTAMIGTLKALGARNSTIQRTFLWLGLFVAGQGILIGDIVAAAIIFVQRQWGPIHLDAQTYYVSTVPVAVDIPFFLLINICVGVVSAVVLLLPSIIIANIKPVKALRFE